ncbi:MAG: hypothetical protein ACOZAQ_02925 [Pseudomonadota bacterium]
MANWFREEIDHLGDRLEQAIEKAGHEISTQRSLTKADMEELIRFAAHEFGDALDERIDKARHETSELVTQKIAMLREQLSEAAAEQKRAMIRNASVAVGATILVGMLSLFYKKYFQGELELIDIFRSALLALAAGYAALVLFRYVHAFLVLPKFKRNAVVLGIKYFDVLRPKGAWGHLLVFGLILGAWAMLNYSDQLMLLLGRL